MLVAWNHSAGTKSEGAAEKFVIRYAKILDQERTQNVTVNATYQEILLTNLRPETEYQITVVAKNMMGESKESAKRIARTSGEFSKNNNW